MLDFLRKRKRSWIITFMLGVIILVFIAFYGGSNYQNTSAGSDVAEVNGDIITQREFTLQYERAVDRYRNMLKGSLTAEMIKSLNIKGGLLEELIQKRLLLQEAHRLGLDASDEQLVNHLAAVPDFQVAGRFNKQRYLQLLRANRLTPSEFEDDQRQQLTIQRLYSLILDSVHVTDAEVRNRYRLEQEKMNLNFIPLRESDFLSEVKLTEDEIKKYYERNKESLKEPLKLRVEYVSYPFDRYTSSVQVSDKEIEDYYQANRDTKFRQPKEAKVRYISIRVPPPADAKERAKAKAHAERVLAEARGGKDFGQLAKRESEDPTAAQGGEVGWIQQGQLPAPLDKAIFGLSKGEISNVVEAPGGFQIIKVEDVKEQKTQSAKEATPEISRILKLEKAKREAAAAADRDLEKALSGGDLIKLAKESGATVSETPWFSNGDTLPEIGANPQFYKAAFALGGKDLSPVVEGNKAYYLLRIKQRKEPTIPPLETVRPKIEQALKSSQAHELLLRKANQVLDQLKKEKDIAKAAAQNGLKVEETGWFPRNAPELPKIGELPDLKPGTLILSAQKPIADRIYTQKDAAYILAFKGSAVADMERFEKEKAALTKQALAEGRQRVMQKFIESLKANATIHVNQSTLEEG